MLHYLALFVAFLAAVLGVYGHFVNKERRLTRNGWIALSVACAGLLVGGALQAKKEREKREWEGIALIRLQQVLNEHISLWRNLHEDGWDIAFFGETVFELPNFLREIEWQEEVLSDIPKYDMFRDSYRSLKANMMDILTLHAKDINPEIQGATERFGRHQMVEYFINWSPESARSSMSLGELADEFRTNPIVAAIELGDLLHARYIDLNLPDGFEDEYRETGHVKDDYQ